MFGTKAKSPQRLILKAICLNLSDKSTQGKNTCFLISLSSITGHLTKSQDLSQPSHFPNPGKDNTSHFTFKYFNNDVK